MLRALVWILDSGLFASSTAALRARLRVLTRISALLRAKHVFCGNYRGPNKQIGIGVGYSIWPPSLGTLIAVVYGPNLRVHLPVLRFQIPIMVPDSYHGSKFLRWFQIPKMVPDS